MSGPIPHGKTKDDIGMHGDPTIQAKLRKLFREFFLVILCMFFFLNSCKILVLQSLVLNPTADLFISMLSPNITYADVFFSSVLKVAHGIRYKAEHSAFNLGLFHVQVWRTFGSLLQVIHSEICK